MKQKIITILALLMSINMALFAQENTPNPNLPAVQNPPVSAEVTAGHRTWCFQTVMSKNLQSAPKFGFASVTNMQVAWGTQSIKDYMVQAHATFDFVKNFSVGLGFHWNPIEGVRPSAQLAYAYGTPVWLISTNLRTDLNGDPNTGWFLLTEFRPKIAQQWHLYLRWQSLASMMPKRGTHARSYIYLRCGVTWKDLTFGAAANLDWYGNDTFHRNNFGGFVAVTLF